MRQHTICPNKRNKFVCKEFFFYFKSKKIDKKKSAKWIFHLRGEHRAAYFQLLASVCSCSSRFGNSHTSLHSHERQTPAFQMLPFSIELFWRRCGDATLPARQKPRAPNNPLNECASCLDVTSSFRSLSLSLPSCTPHVSAVSLQVSVEL